jgi:hypothetical protein
MPGTETTKRIGIAHSTSLPIREVSALASRSGPSGRPELVAVGDEDFAIVTAELDDHEHPRGTQRYDLERVLPAKYVERADGSDFEGVCCDGDGLVFVLQEGKSRVLVLSADLSEHLQTIRLKVGRDEPDFGAAWNDDDNARGEGILLLRQGHVLVAKQKEPTYLIEFGPPGSKPVGVSRKSVLGSDAPFARPRADTAKYVPVASWPLADTTGALPSVNDIAFDERLYLVSSKSGAIVALDAPLEPDHQAHTDTIWEIADPLPGGPDPRAEGLTLVAGDALVGIDTKEAGDNLIVLEALGD